MSRFFETCYLLSNQIHRKFKTNQNILSKRFYNKMADSENMQLKQKLSDEEKPILVMFHKQNKAVWSSEVNFRNKEEKSTVKEDLVSLFDGRFSEDFLDRNFHALHTAENQRNTKIKLQSLTKFNKEDIKHEWHNLQAVYIREKSREESSRVSGSGSRDIYCSTWEHFSQIECFLYIS